MDILKKKKNENINEKRNKREEIKQKNQKI